MKKVTSSRIPQFLRSIFSSVSSVQSLSRVQLFSTPWTTARQASLSITNSRSLLKLMSIESVIPSNHLILCHPLLLLPSISPSIRVFSSESALCIRWPKYWSFSFSISPSNIQDWFPLGWTDWISLQSNTTVQKHQFFSPTVLGCSQFMPYQTPTSKAQEQRPSSSYKESKKKQVQLLQVSNSQSLQDRE